MSDNCTSAPTIRIVNAQDKELCHIGLPNWESFCGLSPATMIEHNIKCYDLCSLPAPEESWDSWCPICQDELEKDTLACEYQCTSGDSQGQLHQKNAFFLVEGCGMGETWIIYARTARMASKYWNRVAVKFWGENVPHNVTTEIEKPFGPFPVIYLIYGMQHLDSYGGRTSILYSGDIDYNLPINFYLMLVEHGSNEIYCAPSALEARQAWETNNPYGVEVLGHPYLRDVRKVNPADYPNIPVTMCWDEELCDSQGL